LRQQWGFNGFVVSDGGAIWDIWARHKYEPTPEAAAAEAVKQGCDLCSGNVAPDRAAIRRSASWLPDTLGWLHGGEDYSVLTNSVAQGLISESEIDTALGHELPARFRLGLFDPPAMVPWSKITMAENDTPVHRGLALKVAEQSIVLLKNDGTLPLDRAKLKRIAVIGPNADSTRMLLGNYSGTPSRSTTILDGLKQFAGTNIDIVYAPGCLLAAKSEGSNVPSDESASSAIAMARSADVVVFAGGVDSSLEKEESNDTAPRYVGFFRGDRTRIELPSPQEYLLHALHALGKPVIFVNSSGSAMALPWEARHLPAILQAWYPGEEGGRAVAEVLFGDVNPSGRLPVTFYASTADLAAFDDYGMSNRTYRYFNGKPVYAFGHGLSYTKFQYADVALDRKGYGAGDKLKLAFSLKNTGVCGGDEVVQVYFRHLNSAEPQPKLSLCGFLRIHLAKGESSQVVLEIPAQRFRYWKPEKRQYVVEPGKYELLIGGASDDIRLRTPVTINNI
jgi:beta-glucosidase